MAVLGHGSSWIQRGAAKPTLAPPKITCSLLLILSLVKIVPSFTLKKDAISFQMGMCCVLLSQSTFAGLCSLSGCLGSRTPQDLPLRVPPQSFLVSERRVGKQWVNGQINDLAGGAGTEGDRGTPSPLPLQRQISSR